MLAKGVPSITYACAGSILSNRIDGPARDLHSGIYGGRGAQSAHPFSPSFSPNCTTRNFRITIPGFYDDVAKLGNAERKALNALPWKKKDFEKAVGAPGYVGEKGFTIVEQTLDPSHA